MEQPGETVPRAPAWGPGRVVLGVVLLAVAAAVAWAGLSALWHLPQPVYRLSVARVFVTLAACAVVLTGLRLLWERAHPWIALGALLVTCLWVLSFISFIGVLTMPIALALTFGLAFASRRVGGGAGEAAAAGLLVAAGLAVLLFAQPWTAAVQCGDGGARSSTRPFDGSSSRGSGESSADGSARGTFGAGEATYAYRCEGGELVEFRRVE